MQTTSTNGMQTPNHLEFHAHVGYSGGELQTWITTFPIISVRHQQQGNLRTKGKYPQSSPLSLVTLPLAQCGHTYPSQSKILFLLLLKLWCSPYWYHDIGYLHHNMLHHELKSRTWARKDEPSMASAIVVTSSWVDLNSVSFLPMPSGNLWQSVS